MFGKVEEHEGINEPVTLAGPAEGVVSKVAYCCSIDYDVVLTNGGVGAGYVGISTCCPIHYNPYCCVGNHVDETTGETVDDYAGVLVVDCIISNVRDMDKSKMVAECTFSNAVSYNLVLWDNCDLTCTCGYNYLGNAVANLTYNPISRTFTTTNECVVCDLQVGGIACLNGLLTFDSGSGSIDGVSNICSCDTLLLYGECAINLASCCIRVNSDDVCFRTNPKTVNALEYMPTIYVSSNSAALSCALSGACSNDSYYVCVDTSVAETIAGVCFEGGYTGLGIATGNRTHIALHGYCGEKALFEYNNGCFILKEVSRKPVEIFQGTSSQWNQLTCDQRKTYDMVAFTDV